MGFDIEGLDKLAEGLKTLAQTGVNELNKGIDRINNPDHENAKGNVPNVCPYCGAQLDNESSETVVKCEYCGAKFDNSADRTIADSIFDFVEKQQKIAQEQKDKKLEIEKIKAQAKAEERAAKRALRRKWAPLRYMIILVLIVFAAMYYYYYYAPIK